MTRIAKATRGRSRWWLSVPLLAVVLGTLVLVQGAFSQPSGVRKPASAAGRLVTPTCGASVSGSVTLAADLTGCTGDGLVVVANGTVINLNGHTISGTGVASGVYNIGNTSVTVKNGAITGFANGVSWVGGSSGTLQGLRVFDNVQIGFYIDAKVSLTGNVSTHNGANGIHVDVHTDGAAISGNRVLSNAGKGIFVNTQHAVSVTGNVANGNGSDGIWLWPSSTPNPGEFSLTPITASGNKAYWNDKLGINAGPGDIDLGKNLASGNSSAHQCENIVCSP